MYTIIFFAHFFGETAECNTYVHAVEGPIGEVRDFVSKETSNLLDAGFEDVEINIIDPNGNEVL